MPNAHRRQPNEKHVVGPRVRVLRQQAGLTMKELADQCGWSDAQQSDLENSKIRWKEHQIHVVAESLGVTPADLISGGAPPSEIRNITVPDDVIGNERLQMALLKFFTSSAGKQLAKEIAAATESDSADSMTPA